MLLLELNKWSIAFYSSIFFLLALIIIIIKIIIIAIRKYRKKFPVQREWRVLKNRVKIIDKGPKKKYEEDLEIIEKPGETNEIAYKIISKRRTFTKFAQVDEKRAEFTRFRMKNQIRIDKETIQHLTALKRLKHDNLVHFFGIQYNQDEDLIFLYMLVERNTLEQFFLEVDVDQEMLDVFKSAFLYDVLRGLEYIHNSPIKYHGLLHAANCLIDSRWMLKITLFGVSNFIADQYNRNNVDTGDSQSNLTIKQYVCFPPEHIREYDPEAKKPGRILYGSPQGDIYNLAMLIFLIVTRKLPFQKEMRRMKYDELLLRLLESKITPSFELNNEKEEQLLEFCKSCWNRDPTQRPSLNEIRKKIQITYTEKSGYLLDQLLRLQEKRAAILEDKVKEKTDELLKAQAKTMHFLNEMLPATIREELANGRIVPPRLYDSATVMFIQICEYVKIQRNCDGKMIVIFLNDVFEQFDRIVQTRDAYKVETTGETYMVASGVPQENYGRHVFEVADLGLAIREFAKDYQLDILNKLKLKFSLRIGFHTGPIAAGVITMKVPRYCLFGDTVNVASRMMSTCRPGGILTTFVTRVVLHNSGRYELEQLGLVNVKGKGETKCYWLIDYKDLEGEEHQEVMDYALGE